MKIEIKNRWTGNIIFTGEVPSLKLAVEHCVKEKISLNHADLRDADLNAADLRGADLTNANLSDADLNAAYLRGANLTNANLRGADLSTSPFTVPHLDAKILAAIEAGGSLQMDNWHSCGTTHCRGGWAIHLAGEAGAALEWLLGSKTAAAMIYAASRPNKRIPDFSGDLDNEKVLADIHACAQEDPLHEK